MKPTLHENGPWDNIDGLLHNTVADTYCQAYEAAVGIAYEIVYKVGEKKMVTESMRIYQERMEILIPGNVPDITIVLFSDFEQISPDDVCTLLNFFLNCIPYEKIQELLALPEPALREKIQSLQACGF